jgi:GTP diphosphokinase / guanosine-3',5'-bis(diphosphate) 3'-diphosphatase
MAVIRINEIIDRLLDYHPQADTALVQKAYVWSAKLHAGALRKDGRTPYLSHPLEVAGILTELKLLEPAIAAGLLHDVVEDTIVTPEALEAEFGKEIGRLVDGVTKIGKITKGATRIEVRAENFRKMILAMAQDVNVILIKLADRLHNMRTLEHLQEDDRLAVAQETLEIYAPIAARLGIHWIQAELEDLAFQHLKPEVFYRLTAQVAKVREARQEYIRQVQQVLEQRLTEAGIEASVSGRFKHLYSIYIKMQEQKLAFDEVHDLMAFRIIVDSINNCYDALRVIHSVWKPVPRRIKDFIALPKSNMYRSLHTTVIGPEGKRVEIQIRTAEMHAIAEHGIAAHWRYKEKGSSPPSADEKATLGFLDHLVQYQEELKDPRHFLETIKSEVIPDEIMVFTPAGDIISLPHGATPIDLAYAIHSHLGDRCGGAKVNGKIVPLNHPLQSGDTAEIITSKSVEPTKAWLDIVKSPRARTHIARWLSAREAVRVREIGRQILEAELLNYGLALGQLLESGRIADIAGKFSFSSPSRLFEAIGFGKFPLRKVLSRLVDPEQLHRKPRVDPTKRAEHPVRKTAVRKTAGRKTAAAGRAAKGPGKPKPAPQAVPSDEDSFPDIGTSLMEIKSLNDPLLPLAPCCNPIPGDEVVAVRRDDDSLLVHRPNCSKVLETHPERLIAASWDPKLKGLALAVLEIVSADQMGMLVKITTAISNAKADIVRALAHTTEEKKAIHVFHLSVKNLRQLKRVVSALEKIDGVITVNRL